MYLLVSWEWREDWILEWPLDPNTKKLKITIQKPKVCNVKNVKDVINPTTKEWNERIRQNIISMNEINELKRIRISENQHEDKIRWYYEKR